MRRVFLMDTNFTSVSCSTCHHEVSVAHVTDSYTCLRLAGFSIEAAQETTR